MLGPHSVHSWIWIRISFVLGRIRIMIHIQNRVHKKLEILTIRELSEPSLDSERDLAKSLDPDPPKNECESITPFVC